MTATNLSTVTTNDHVHFQGYRCEVDAARWHDRILIAAKILDQRADVQLPIDEAYRFEKWLLKASRSGRRPSMRQRPPANPILVDTYIRALQSVHGPLLKALIHKPDLVP